MELGEMWQGTTRHIRKPDGWNRLNLDAILDATIDRTATLATVELSGSRLGNEKKYIARHGAETSSRMAVYFLFHISSNKKQFMQALRVFLWFWSFR